MGYLLYFALVGLQVSSTLAAGKVPLNCFLQNQNFLNIFSRRTEVTSDGGSINPLQFDPIRIEAIDLNMDGWRYNATNLEYSGLNNAVLDDYGFNFNTNITHLYFHTDMLVTCQYMTDGLFFSLPISGAGSCIVYFNNIQFGMTAPFNVLEEYGQQFINLRNYYYFYNVRDGANFTLTNLYFGDKEQSDIIHHFLNYNWKFVSERYTRIFIDAAVEIIFEMLRNTLLDMPLKGPISC